MSKKNTLAAVAIVCAIGGFFATPGWGAFLGLGAVILGLLGFLKSVSPQAKGGVMSIAAILLGLVVLVVKIIAGALTVLF